jgi:hypothetical protein
MTIPSYGTIINFVQQNWFLIGVLGVIGIHVLRRRRAE